MIVITDVCRYVELNQIDDSVQLYNLSPTATAYDLPTCRAQNRGAHLKDNQQPAHQTAKMVDTLDHKETSYTHT